MSKYSAANLRAGVRFSQNFLTSSKTIARLLQCTNIAPQDQVLEIGPGKGHITRQLLARCGHLTCVEIDPKLCQRLAQDFSQAPHFTLIPGDFLKMPLPRGAYKVFSNLPFNQTSAILGKLSTAANPAEDCFFIMEKGAAKRFLGLPRESLSSLLLKPLYEGRICYHLRREDFHPMPACDTVLVHLARRESPHIRPQERDAYERFLRAMVPSWNQSRPALLSKHQMRVALRQAGLEPLPMDATLSYVQWLCLYRCWRQWSPRA